LARPVPQGAADEAQGIVEATLQLRSDNVVAQRFVRAVDAFREAEHEVAARDALGDLNEVFDEGHGRPVISSLDLCDLALCTVLGCLATASSGFLRGLPGSDLIQSQTEITRLLLEEALEVIAHRHIEVGVDVVVPLLEPGE